MNEHVEQTIRRYNLLEYGDTVVVALSGGADSVCLLDVINSIKEKYNLTIYAAHINHNLRGDEAKSDENFCKTICKKYNIELFVKSADVKTLAAKQKISEELCGRNVRYEFFDELSKNLSAKVATAHTASDNAETLIFNLARGCLVGGMAAIPPKRGYIIRPLIETTRADVERYCAEHSLEYVTDSTNLTDDYTRNNIRHNVVPVLKGINPAFEKAALNLSSNAREILDFLTNCAYKAIDDCKNDFGYDCSKFLELDKAVLKQAIIILFRNNYNISLEQRHISLICNIIKDGGSVEISKSLTAVSKQGIFRVVQTNLHEDFEDIILNRNNIFDYNNKLYSVSELNSKIDINTINADLANSGAVFRNRRQGDTFTYPKRKVTKPLRKILNEQKIPAELRDELLVLAKGSTVLWCECIGASLEGQALSAQNALKINIKYN